jgi:hypothetical protein
MPVVCAQPDDHWGLSHSPLAPVMDAKSCIFKASRQDLKGAAGKAQPRQVCADAPPLLSLSQQTGEQGPSPFASHSPALLWSPTVFEQSLRSPLIREEECGNHYAIAFGVTPPSEGATPNPPHCETSKFSKDPQPPLSSGPPREDPDDARAAANRIADEIVRNQCTTLMIRNLPNKLTPPMIMECVHELGFEEEYDYLFVPIDTNAPGWANRNLGYCFLNLTSPDVARRFCLLAYGYSFRQAVSSTKTSKISIAEEQGVLLNLCRIDRPGPRKESRGGGKHSSYPFVRVGGVMQTLAPAAALALVDPDGAGVQ